MRQGAGSEHLAAIAREPRAAGTDGERRARDHAATVLREAGFTVLAEPFEYSALPGRYGTPAGGALALIVVLGSAWLALDRQSPDASSVALLSGLLLLGLSVTRLMGDTVVTLPWMRRTSENLSARRGTREPVVWLVAHLDSKSQPVSSALRVVGVTLLALGVTLALVAGVLQLAGSAPRTLWWVAVGLSTLGALPVMASVVGNRSVGAVDNASGVAAVLAAAQTIDEAAAVGVLLPSAEELGMAGARAWVRTRGARGIAINCDGVDDHGELTIMYSRSRPDALIEALTRHAERGPRVRRMPLGLLTDSVAFADAGWATVTVSRGSMRTLARVHSENDSLERLRGDGIDEVSALLARTATELGA